MIRIEAYPVMDGLVLHIAASNLKEVSTLAGGNGMSVHRFIEVATIEKHGIDDALFMELVSVFRLYAGLGHYALR